MNNQIEPTGKQSEFLTSTSKFSCFSGGFGCVAGETKVFDPLTGKHARMDSLSGASIYAYYDGKLIPAFATRPKQYKKRNLYKVKTVRSNTILVTKQHRFQTRLGWRSLAQIKPSEDLLVSAGFHPLTILEFFQSILLSGVQSFWRKVQDFPRRCFAYFRLYGVLLQGVVTNALQIAPSPAYVALHTLRNSQRDVRDKVQEYNHAYQSLFQISKSDSSNRVDRLSEDAVDYAGRTIFGLPLLTFPQPAQSLLRISLVRQAKLFVLKLRRGFWTSYYKHTLRWEKVSSIDFERKDFYYDLHVPNLNNYLANGFINHNSGKTVAGCLRALILSQFPGNFGLIGRLTYPELRDTTRKTFFEICPPEYYDEAHGGQWKPSENYLRLVNGSEIIFRHLDNVSEKELLSLNLGWFFIDQAEETGEGVFRILQSRLRLNTIPNRYGFIICNPEPGNWIDHMFRRPIINNERDNPGNDFHFIESASTDNPHLPPDYIPTLLQTYPEEMVKRFVEGRWDVFENQIYHEYDYKVHCVAPFDIPRGWERIVAVDHGMVNPTAALWCALDYDGNLFIYDEYYAPGIVSHHAKQILEKSAGQEISLWLIDPSTQAKTREKDGDMWSVIEEYEDYGLFFTPANNEKLAGINRVKEFLKPQPSRRNPITKDVPSPRLFIFKNCVNLINEMPQYQWRKLRTLQSRNSPEQPRDFNDHAVDALRYIIMSRFPAPLRRGFGKDEMILPEQRRNMNVMTQRMQEYPDSELGSLYQQDADVESTDDLTYGETFD